MNFKLVLVVEWCEFQTHLAAFNRLNAVRVVAIRENPAGENKPRKMTVSLRVLLVVTVVWQGNGTLIWRLTEISVTSLKSLVTILHKTNHYPSARNKVLQACNTSFVKRPLVMPQRAMEIFTKFVTSLVSCWGGGGGWGVKDFRGPRMHSCVSGSPNSNHSHVVAESSTQKAWNDHVHIDRDGFSPQCWTHCRPWQVDRASQELGCPLRRPW